MFDVNPGLPDEITDALNLHQVGAIALIIGVFIVVALVINFARKNFEGAPNLFVRMSWVAGLGAILLGLFLLMA